MPDSLGFFEVPVKTRQGHSRCWAHSNASLADHGKIPGYSRCPIFFLHIDCLISHGKIWPAVVKIRLHERTVGSI